MLRVDRQRYLQESGQYYYTVTCAACPDAAVAPRDFLKDATFKWFGDTPYCNGACPRGWTALTGPVSSGPGRPASEDRYFGSPCEIEDVPGKVLCALPGRKACNRCTYRLCVWWAA